LPPKYSVKLGRRRVRRLETAGEVARPQGNFPGERARCYPFATRRRDGHLFHLRCSRPVPGLRRSPFFGSGDARAGESVTCQATSCRDAGLQVVANDRLRNAADRAEGVDMRPPISDHSCATPSNHSGMVVFPPSGRIRRYLRPRITFYPTPDRELAMRLENGFTPWSAWFRRHPHMALCRSLICARAALSMADRYPAAARGGECPSAPRPPPARLVVLDLALIRSLLALLRVRRQTN
jgi:hypothetical protein